MKLHSNIPIKFAGIMDSRRDREILTAVESQRTLASLNRWLGNVCALCPLIKRPHIELRGGKAALYQQGGSRSRVICVLEDPMPMNTCAEEANDGRTPSLQVMRCPAGFRLWQKLSPLLALYLNVQDGRRLRTTDQSRVLQWQ